MATIRFLKDTDYPQIVDLIKTNMPLPDYSERYFKWKLGYRLNNKNETITPLGVLAEENNIIVAFACFFPYLLWNGEIIWNVDDVVTHTNYRRKGFFNKVMKYGLERIDNRKESTYLFSSQIARKGYLSLGYQDKYDLDYFVCIPKKFALIANKLFPKPKQTKPDNRFEYLFNKLQEKHKVVFDKISSFSTELDADIPAWAVKNIFAKDALYLNWRYSNHPIKKYDCYLLRNLNQEIIGYSILNKLNIIEFAVKEIRSVGSVFAFAKIYFTINQTLVGNIFLHSIGEIMQQIKKQGYLKWDYEWRPAGLYSKHTVMARELNPTSGDVFTDKLFTMGNINCGF